ncbi:MAG: carbamoyltransferase HypF [Firmicutes bacterium HGW-Firmicutes-1]|nr:MAG: carbamoyltransferase HypF [Firmicutes bacterium HGW-Firmicutes-1]
MKRAYELQVYGVVQGVGFRPFIYQQAERYGLYGWVKNEGGSVHIHIEGIKDLIKSFILILFRNPPPLAQIQEVKIQKGVVKNHTNFTIKISSHNRTAKKFLPVDAAICDKCIEEIKDNTSNRYHYAFTNCTSCGPRYSILEELPYDRKFTTMQQFTMCLSCTKEYEDPTSRRFHAQPNCCIHCGPELFLCDGDGIEFPSNHTIKKTVELIRKGHIIAIKGLGGFHLCCDALNQMAIEKLRERKHRPHKPFAIMAKDINAIKQICDVTIEEENIIKGSRKPIVLLNKMKANILCAEVAPRLNEIGVMLPYTPLHFLLFEEDISYIVMTSGNSNQNPICYTNQDAIHNLNNIADYFLMHNRDIYVPIDDSVVKIVNHKEKVSRLARGYAPRFFKGVDDGIQHNILGVGAEQKNTFSIFQNGYIHTSPYIGDLEEMDTYLLYKDQIQHFEKILQFSPTVIAHDYHPDYTTTKYAIAHTVQQISVQHHHAHMVSCMVEHKLNEAVIGVIYDGTGYGLDDTIWGGEFFIGTRGKLKRVGHLQYATLQGGALVIKEIWRSAVGFLWSIGIDASRVIKGIDEYVIQQIQKALDANLNCYKTSSIGRLFDCVAALIGMRLEITYDAQGAIELEATIVKNIDEAYYFEIDVKEPCFQIKYEFILLGIIEDLKNDISISVIATKFHNTLIEFTIAGVCSTAEKYNIQDVVISGGVFENAYLLEKITSKLQEEGFRVFHNEQIPINDSGISVGQVAVAQAQLLGEAFNVFSNSR